MAAGGDSGANVDGAAATDKDGKDDVDVMG